jgi:hypothetical protein
MEDYETKKLNLSNEHRWCSIITTTITFALRINYIYLGNCPVGLMDADEVSEEPAEVIKLSHIRDEDYEC